MSEVIFFGSAAGAAPCLKEAYDHSCVMDEALGLVAQALRQIEAGEDMAGAFQCLTSNLLHLLRLANRSPCIEGSLDHLHEVARRLIADMRVDGLAGPGRHQDLHAAYLTFRGQISTARLRGSALGDDVSATPTLVRVNLERQRSIPDRSSPQHGALRSMSGTLQGPDLASWLGGEPR